MASNSRRNQLLKEIEIPPDELDDFIERNRDLLSDREFTAVTEYFGVFARSRTTLDVIGGQLGGVQRERVRQFKARAVYILRTQARAEKDLPNDPLDQTIEQFFNLRRIRAVGAERQAARILNCMRNEYGKYGADHYLLPVRVETVIAGGRRRLLQSPNMSKKCVNAIEVMLKSAGLQFAPD